MTSQEHPRDNRSNGASHLICIGTDNLNVLRGVAKLIDHGMTGPPLHLTKDGDLLAVIHSMLTLRGEGTVQVTEVKGHAVQAMVDKGNVLQEDLIGDGRADAAADLGRSRQQDFVISARRALFRARRQWYPVVLDLHKFLVAISRIEVNHGGYGSTAPDPTTWDKGSNCQTPSLFSSGCCRSLLAPRSSSVP